MNICNKFYFNFQLFWHDALFNWYHDCFKRERIQYEKRRKILSSQQEMLTILNKIIINNIDQIKLLKKRNNKDLEKQYSLQLEIDNCFIKFNKELNKNAKFRKKMENQLDLMNHYCINFHINFKRHKALLRFKKGIEK